MALNFMMHQHYFIEETSNRDKDRIHGKEYNDPLFYPEFQIKYEEIKNTIVNVHSIVILRVYDGEFLFLEKKVGGNGPKRHYSKALTNDFIKPFYDGCNKVDLISVQINTKMMNKFENIFNRPCDFPMDIIYGLFANKWLLSTFKNQIALIGGKEKIDVIKELMKHEEYRNYVCTDYFVDYITVPERYSCDVVDDLIINIGNEIKHSKAKLFLFGIGISKMAIAWQFKNYKQAKFIDIGCGMSALAGTCSTFRPYFGNWINYRLKNYNYKKMDPMDFNIKIDNVKYLDN